MRKKRVDGRSPGCAAGELGRGGECGREESGGGGGNGGSRRGSGGGGGGVG